MLIRRTLTVVCLIVLVTPGGVTAVSATPQAKVYTVNSDTAVGDAAPGDGVCDTGSGNCTLHAAIQEANLDQDYSTIKFASNFQGTHDIDGCGLPPITEDGTTIDASDRWDNAYDRPGVEIVGGACTLLAIQASSTTVLGVLFGGSGSTGVHITSGSLNSIGGYDEGQRNVFLVGTYGVWIQSTGTYNYVVNSYFGTVTGDALPGGGVGQRGVFVQAGESWSIISNNLIVGQSDAGVLLWSDSNVVTENIIGLDTRKQKALANNVGVKLVWADYNVIGPDNIIAGNTSHGVEIYHANDNMVYRNYIGYSMGGALPNGGDGVHIHASMNNWIGEGNLIGPNDGHGVWVNGSGNTAIRGNGIGDNGEDGIYLLSSDGQIGGVGDGKRNSIGGNDGHGIHLDASSNVTITNNYIGLNLGAFENGNGGHGILIDNGSSGNFIGGSSAAEGNRIGWNHLDGIRLEGSSTQNNYVLGNVIGMAVPGVMGTWETPNHHHGIGIYDGAHDNSIGWSSTIDYGNIIMASGWSGVAIVNSDNNDVLFNKIGTDGATIEWGNAFYGVDVVESAGTSIKLNEIAYNGKDSGENGAEAGVHVSGINATDNMITGNSIHDNDGPGIKLENGGNDELAAPIIDSADCGSLQGHTSPICVNCWVEIYSDNEDEGRVYEGHFTTPPSGQISWNGTLNGLNVTAIVIEQGGPRNTSEFSAPINVGACNAAPTAALIVNPNSGTPSTDFHFDASGCSDSTDPTSALQVRWDWENDGIYDTGWRSTKTATHSYNSPATYTVRVEVLDTWGLKDSAMETVTVLQEHRVHLPIVISR